MQMTKQSVLLDQADHKTHDCHDGKNDKENLRDFYGTCCDATKAEHGGNQRDHQKYDGIMQHLKLLDFLISAAGAMLNIETPAATLASIDVCTHRLCTCWFVSGEGGML
jgi:hypothetical protein